MTTTTENLLVELAALARLEEIVHGETLASAHVAGLLAEYHAAPEVGERAEARAFELADELWASAV